MAWDVELALQEVIVEIGKGADPLNLQPETQKLLKDKYRPDFEEQAKAGRIWEDDKEDILPLARIVGRLAALLTYIDRAVNDSESTIYVDQRHANRAAYVVSRLTANTRGKYCHSYTLGDPRSNLIAKGLALSLKINALP